LSVTVILVEHSLERNVFYANKMAIIENGTIILENNVDSVLKAIFQNDFYKNYLPQIDRAYLEFSQKDKSLPLNNRKFNKILNDYQNQLTCLRTSSELADSKKVLKVKNLSFKFDFESKKIINNINFTLKEGRSYCLVGPNGVGKSTLIRVISQ